MKISSIRIVGIISISLILLILIAYLDFITGNDLSFFVFYFIPILIISWYTGRPLAIVTSLLAAVAWLLVDKISGRPYSHWTFLYWNAFVRWTSFVILAVTISQLKYVLEKEKKLKHDLSDALTKIKLYIATVKKIADGETSISTTLLDKSNNDSLDKTFAFVLKRITEQKYLEKRLFQLERQSIMAETASFLAHEIRNPLNLIMLTAHHVGNQFIPTDETQKTKFNELITSLKSEVDQLNKVISDFISMGKSTKLNKQRFALSDVFKQVNIMIKQQLTVKNISLICSGDLDVSVYADPDQLRLVFLNLFVNATAAVSHNGKIWFHVDHQPVEKSTIITVTDDGPGVNEQDIERIFEPYFTLKPGGTGLGLALVKRIINDHNGKIAAENCRNCGAQFKITLPSEE